VLHAVGVTAQHPQVLAAAAAAAIAAAAATAVVHSSTLCVCVHFQLIVHAADCALGSPISVVKNPPPPERTQTAVAVVVMSVYTCASVYQSQHSVLKSMYAGAGASYTKRSHSSTRATESSTAYKHTISTAG
jgi:hypothetical protein